MLVSPPEGRKLGKAGFWSSREVPHSSLRPPPLLAVNPQKLGKRLRKTNGGLTRHYNSTIVSFSNQLDLRKEGQDGLQPYQMPEHKTRGNGNKLRKESAAFKQMNFIRRDLQ